MKKHQKKIISLVTKEIILSIFDIKIPIYKFGPKYAISINDVLGIRRDDRTHFLSKVRYWQRQGYINYFVENKEKYIELTAQGRKRLEDETLDEIKIKRRGKWDGKWRVVIFDVPEEYHSTRDLLRLRLKQLGFYRIQMSVYAYPFECAEEIRELSRRLKAKKHVLLMISEIIQNEGKIINYFLKKGVLRRGDLVIQKRK
ncbi:MAG: PaaX family transcrtiptional regulator [Candidatus Berkelbacteria bacterium Licking1014_96]|uniref:PaaX family transcrtiptional regulator n=1 Tax=Candidatus Berkelbacteria bacterium Licking1014_96 TaxID=2017149 RepID=A0A554LGY9_9BACT|nr:MAG: PaaX family transcrtiptional regulator [Candidatus Berkelbacteria bacterium Licking1014_96]